MTTDAYIIDRRIEALHNLPWCLPANVVLEMTDEDLDRLAAAPEADYWRVLGEIVSRVTEVQG